MTRSVVRTRQWSRPTPRIFDYAFRLSAELREPHVEFRSDVRIHVRQLRSFTTTGMPLFKAIPLGLYPRIPR